MELLLIPFLVMAGAGLIYLGVHGVPAAPWTKTGRDAPDEPADGSSEPVVVPGAFRDGGPIIVETVATVIEHEAKPERGRSKLNLLKNVRPRRHGTSAIEAAEAETAVQEVFLPDVEPDRAEVAIAGGLADAGLAEDAEHVATVGPSPVFGESDALMGQLLMEMSSVRSEIKELRNRVERLTIRPIAVTRAPGEPRRRRMRRISRF
jgi:hypothetical protein